LAGLCWIWGEVFLCIVSGEAEPGVGTVPPRRTRIAGPVLRRMFWVFTLGFIKTVDVVFLKQGVMNSASKARGTRANKIGRSDRGHPELRCAQTAGLVLSWS